jgi:hypothetical protein
MHGETVKSIIVLDPMQTVSVYDMVWCVVCSVWWRDNNVIYIIRAVGTLNGNTVLHKLLIKCKINYKAHKEDQDIPR